MGLPALLTLFAAAVTSGVAWAFWFVPVSFTAAIGLGGSPAHLSVALLATLTGLALGRLAATSRAGSTRRPAMVALMAAAAGSWWLFQAGTFPPWGATHANTAGLMLLSALFGLASPLGTDPRRAPGLSVLGTAALGVGIAPAFLLTARFGARSVLGMAFLLAAVALGFARTTKPALNTVDTHGQATTRGASISSFAAAILLGGMLVATVHLLDSGRFPTRLPLWGGLSALVLASTLALLLRKKLPTWLSSQPVGSIAFAVSGVAAAVPLMAPPGWPVRRLLPEDQVALLDPAVLLVITLTALGGAALSTVCAAPQARRQARLLTIAVPASGYVWEATVLPTLGTEGFLRLLAFLGFSLATTGTLIALRHSAARTFGTITRGIGFAVCIPLPLLVTPWEPDLGSICPSPPGESSNQGDAGEVKTLYRADQHGAVVACVRPQGDYLSVRGYPPRPRPASDTDPFLAALPILLNPQAREVLIAGAGTGQALDLLRTTDPARLTWAAVSASRAAPVSLFADDNHQVLLDPRLAVRFDSLQPLSRRLPQAFDAALVFAPPLHTLERDHLYSLEGLQAVRRLLRDHGVAVVELPLGGDRNWLTRVLSTFHRVFPDGLVWLCPGAQTSLALTGGPSSGPVSVAALERGLAQPGVRQRLRALRISTVEDVLAQLLLTPEGLQDLKAPPLRCFRRLPEYGDREREAFLATLLPLLRPLGSTVRVEGTHHRPEAIQRVLEDVLAHHRAYLSMLMELDRGVFTKVVEEARKLAGGKRGYGSELEGLTGPYVRRARRYLSAGELDKAIEQLSVVRIIDPKRSDVPLLLGEIYEQKGDPDRALSLYQETLRLDPASVAARVRLAGLYGEQGRHAEAISLLEQVTPKRPNDPVLYHNLGTLYLAQGNLDKAKENFERAIQLDRSLARAHAGLADVLFRSGRTGAAALEAEIAVRLDPTPYALNLQGQIALRQGEREKARTAFARCLLKDPDHIEARGGMGIIAAEDGDIDTARESWEKILQMDPDNRAARENLRRLDEMYPR